MRQQSQNAKIRIQKIALQIYNQTREIVIVEKFLNIVELNGKRTSLLRGKGDLQNKQAEMWAFLNLSFAKKNLCAVAAHIIRERG